MTETPDPRPIIGGMCPICFNVLKAVVYERRTVVEKGHSCGPGSPKPFERSVDAYIRTEMYSCGLERSVAWRDGVWGKYSYGKSRCANAQAMALTMRDELIRHGLQHKVSELNKLEVTDCDGKESKKVVPEGHEDKAFEIDEGEVDYPDEPSIAWCKCGSPARGCGCENP